MPLLARWASLQICQIQTLDDKGANFIQVSQVDPRAIQAT